MIKCAFKSIVYNVKNWFGYFTCYDEDDHIRLTKEHEDMMDELIILKHKLITIIDARQQQQQQEEEDDVSHGSELSMV